MWYLVNQIPGHMIKGASKHFLALCIKRVGLRAEQAGRQVLLEPQDVDRSMMMMSSYIGLEQPQLPFNNLGSGEVLLQKTATITQTQHCTPYVCLAPYAWYP